MAIIGHYIKKKYDEVKGETDKVKELEAEMKRGGGEIVGKVREITRVIGKPKEEEDKIKNIREMIGEIEDQENCKVPYAFEEEEKEARKPLEY